ncbi:hypothetical protein OXYTRIMIC_302 [Oxytricha trifallax]|uniref:Uncharacterized protein n=1 Tax=Oxytricha trifallax TaxID=1172189 RepID=A0A073HYQ3_9SPIT|nr:hypothetical protein OXYTRIMIC_302 [Oxytricha trifallax]
MVESKDYEDLDLSNIETISEIKKPSIRIKNEVYFYILQNFSQYQVHLNFHKEQLQVLEMQPFDLIKSGKISIQVKLQFKLSFIKTQFYDETNRVHLEHFWSMYLVKNAINKMDFELANRLIFSRNCQKQVVLKMLLKEYHDIVIDPEQGSDSEDQDEPDLETQHKKSEGLLTLIAAVKRGL